MKSFFYSFSFLLSISVFGQFQVKITAPSHFSSEEAILYTLMGSKDVIVSKGIKQNNQWKFKVPTNYVGMMKVYFPEINGTINFISENKDVEFGFDVEKNKITQVYYQDAANELMDKVQDIEQKKEIILPALYQINEYYKKSSDFKTAVNTEINRLSTQLNIDPLKYPFVSYYNLNYNKFLVKEVSKPEPSTADIIQFINNSNEYLESSSLLRPILVSLLNKAPKTNVDSIVDTLLTKVNVETPRGQVVLSELIDVFDAYGMNNLKSKYLSLAKNLKCTISDRLSKTIKQNENTEIGAVFPDYIFQNAKKTNAKSLHSINAKNKIIVFWSSTCSHCETELPKLIPIYTELKKRNVEIIGFSLDTDNKTYTDKTSVFPWVDTTELKGWNSNFVETYNVHATPTFFILDEKNKIIDKPDHVQDVLQYFNLK
ncbi:MAG: TlpA family protein disulfide reductase [Bacteroidetes bacterium]|nr:TlpA family protein disulfide reductase [Bacteroidota bacterium]